MISIQSRPDALCARSFLQLRTIFCRFAVLLDFRGFRCYSVTTRSGHLILCGAICGVLALFHLPAKYIAFFCAIFILLLACVSAKYLKGSRMQSVPSCTFSQNRAFVCFLSIVYCWFLWFFRPPFLYSWHPFFAFVIYFVSRAKLSTILGYISKPLVTYI